MLIHLDHLVVQRIFQVKWTIGSATSDRETSQWLLYISPAVELPTNHRLRRWRTVFSSRTGEQTERWKPAGAQRKRAFCSSMFVCATKPLLCLRVSMDIRVFFGVLLCLCVLRSSSCARSDVLELRDSDFDYLAPEHETLLVKFYAPWWEIIHLITHLCAY